MAYLRICLLLSFASLAFGEVSRCQYTPRICADVLGYNYTQMPNYFNQTNATEAVSEMTKIFPIEKCSPLLTKFLCILYAPPCMAIKNLFIPPCRQACERALSSYDFLLHASQALLIEKINCKNFPASPLVQLCIDFTKGMNATSTTLKPTIATTRPQTKCSDYYLFEHRRNIRDYIERNWYFTRCRSRLIDDLYNRNTKKESGSSMTSNYRIRRIETLVNRISHQLKFLTKASHARKTIENIKRILRL